MRLAPVYSYEAERESNLLRLWDQNQEVVHKILRKYKWIPPQQYDDYRQEIFIHIWKNFYRWMEKRHSFLEFEQWLFMEGRAAAFSFRRKELKVRYIKGSTNLFTERYRYLDNMADLKNIVEDDYNESALEGLRKAIEDLEDDDKQVIHLILNEVDLHEEERKNGKPHWYYSSQLWQIKNKIRKNYRRYFEDMRIFIEQRKSAGRGADCPSAKPVLQLGLSGEVIKRWPSAIDAESAGFKRKQISNVINGNKGSHHGFKWALESQYLVDNN